MEGNILLLMAIFMWPAGPLSYMTPGDQIHAPLASFPGSCVGRRKESLVHTVCACTKFPLVTCILLHYTKISVVLVT